MKPRTTWILLLAAIGLGALIFVLDQRARSRAGVADVDLAFRIQPKHMRYLRYERNDLVLELERREGQWRLTRPLAARADEGAVARLLIGLQNLPRGRVLTPEDLREAGQTAADYGFRHPQAQVTLGGERAQQTFLIGRDAPVGPWLYAQSASRQEIMTVSSKLLDLFPEDPASLRDTALFRGLPSRTERVEVRGAGGFLALVPGQGGSWMLEQPVKARTQRATVQAIMDLLFQARVEDFVADGLVDAAVYGIDEGSAQVSIALRGSSRPQVLKLGSLVEDNPAAQYAWLEADNAVVAVSTSFWAAVHQPLEVLRDPRLLPIHPQDVRAVRLEQGDRVMTLAATSNLTWKVLEPREWPADPVLVAHLVGQWSSAMVHTFLDLPMTNAVEHTGQEAEFSLAFMTGEEDALQTPEWSVHIADAELSATATTVRVWTEPEQVHGLIDAGLVRSLPRSPIAFRDRTVLALDPDSVRKITRVSGGVTQVVTRVETGAFAPVTEGGETARKDVIEALLEHIRGLRAVAFVPESDSLGNLILEESADLSLTFGLASEVGLGKALLVGGVTPDGTGRYAALRGHEDIFVLDSTTVNILLRELVEPARDPAGDGDG